MVRFHPRPYCYIGRCHLTSVRLLGKLKGTYGTSSSDLEDDEENLDGDEKVRFLAFLRKMLQWRPEDRATTRELLDDPWLKPGGRALADDAKAPANDQTSADDSIDDNWVLVE